MTALRALRAQARHFYAACSSAVIPSAGASSHKVRLTCRRCYLSLLPSPAAAQRMQTAHLVCYSLHTAQATCVALPQQCHHLACLLVGMHLFPSIVSCSMHAHRDAEELTLHLHVNVWLAFDIIDASRYVHATFCIALHALTCDMATSVRMETM